MIIFKPTYKDKATGETRTSSHYYLRYKSKRYPLGVTDRRLAEEKAKQLIANLEIGFDPRQHDKAKSEPLVRLVLAYTDAMDTTEKQKYQVRLRLTKLMDGLKARTLVELTAERVQGWIQKSKLARRTKAHYTTMMKTFGGWLAEAGHTPRNPFEGLETVRQIESDRRLVRRALTPEQLDLLIATAENSLRKLCKLTGPQRAMLYRLVVNTGLRRNEAASLTPASFTLKDQGTSTVEVQAAYTKNRTKAVLPLPQSLVPLLREYLRGLPADRSVWPLKPTSMTQHMVQKDMAEAGMDVKVGDTSYDFHSLRGQYATRLANAGVPLVKAAALLRHSDPRLTMAVYTHLTTEDLAAEVDKLG